MPGRYRVVHVDDLAEVRQIVRLILQQSGWFDVVGEAGDGVEGLEVITRHQPDLVLLDVEMPGPSGWAVLPRIREAVPEAAVVILSGTGGEAATVAPEVRSMAAAVLAKGVPSGELIETLLSVAPLRPAAPDAEVAAPWPAAPTQPAPALDDVSTRLSALVDASPDAIIGQTVDGRIASWNPAAERVYGYAAEEAVGQPIAMLFPPDRREDLGRMHRQLLAGDPIAEFETVRLRKDGSLVEVAVRASPVRAPGGEVVGIWSIARDISARREADAALARAVAQLEHQNRELRRSNEELESFASVASHDIAQPLQVAFGYLEMLRSDFAGQLDPVALGWLDSSVRSLDRMRHLVQDILQYARTGSRETIPEAVDLGAVVATALDAVESGVEDRGARVEVGDLPTVLGNRNQLAQVFQNLLANAIKFVPPGTSPAVRVTAASTAEGWQVTVCDNGPGVAPEERDRIFDMFHRAHGAEVAGTGLGLAICKKLVHRHGGRIWVDDAPGGGAAFHVVLPR